MAGHSKWSKVKRQKAVTDRQKGLAFAKLSKLITLAVIEGGGHADPEHNVRLRMIIEKAKAANMPKDNIQKAIEKAAGPGKDALKEVHYEAFGHEGAALLIVATTDNPNRTTSEVKNTLERNGGKLGAQGSVAYMFQHCGVIHISRAAGDSEVFAAAEKMDAVDIDQDDAGYYVCIPFQAIGHVKDHSGALDIMSVEVLYRPLMQVQVTQATLQSIDALMIALEDLDDVQHVYTNAEQAP